ncbi:MAG: AmmeMemoRadiSam system radical SAM enzyme [Bacteroidetes bacterium]|nr:AmmeMemoRadiSam system radical SAM enzyme [Bacteroidota bacterium]
MASSLKELITHYSRKGTLFRELPNSMVQCVACGHKCKIAPGNEGICKVRFNRNGTLYVPYGYVAGLALDPIEKKPFFHAFPGSSTLSFGMLGCDLKCPFCQNWGTSQVLRDPDAYSDIETITPEHLIQLAQAYKSNIITSTYNEPLITSEWAVEIFKLAKYHKMITAYVSNGNASEDVLEYLDPWLDLIKIDLKAFHQKFYSEIGGNLKTVLTTIESLYKRGKWIEIVTLIIPGKNDSDSELADIAHFIASVSPTIPWHVTAYHDAYRMQASEPVTSTSTLLRAVKIGYEAGLKFVYAGNRPGETQNYENTYCPSCKALLIERKGFRILSNELVEGKCPQCSTTIPGRWYFQ